MSHLALVIAVSDGPSGQATGVTAGSERMRLVHRGHPRGQGFVWLAATA